VGEGGRESGEGGRGGGGGGGEERRRVLGYGRALFGSGVGWRLVANELRAVASCESATPVGDF